METSEVKIRMEAAVQKIRNEDLRNWVLSVLAELPEKAWQREASLTYHHKDEQVPGGNKIHEIRTAKVADTLATLYNLNSQERDIVKAASLLHDLGRHGPDAAERYTLKDHATRVRPFIEENCPASQWTDVVCSLIETHMSRWGVPLYQPSIDLRDIIILADFIASQPYIEIRE